MDNLGYLAAAYCIIWIAISLVAFNLYRKQKQLWREIDSLKEQLKNKRNN